MTASLNLRDRNVFHVSVPRMGQSVSVEDVVVLEDVVVREDVVALEDVVLVFLSFFL